MQNEQRSMYRAGKTDFVFSDCSKKQLQKIKDSRDKGHCLFTKDVFSKDDQLVVPHVSRATVIILDASSDLPLFMFYFKYLPRVDLELRRSMMLTLDENKVCFYYESRTNESLAAFEFCPSQKTVNGVFHRKDMRINLFSLKLQHKTANAIRITQHRNAKQVMPIIRGKISGKPIIRVLIGIDTLFINRAGDVALALRQVLQATNAAEAFYRSIGIRFELTGFIHMNSDKSLVGSARYYYRTQNRRDDAFLLFTGDNHVARCGGHGVCRKGNVAVISFNDDSYVVAGEVAHQIGHLLGMRDEIDCSCRTAMGQCVMTSEASSRALLWSSCNFEYMQSLNFRNITCEENDSKYCGTSDLVTALRIIVAICTIITVIAIIVIALKFASSCIRSANHAGLML